VQAALKMIRWSKEGLWRRIVVAGDRTRLLLGMYAAVQKGRGTWLDALPRGEM
jgi:hypothetical protein